MWRLLCCLLCFFLHFFLHLTTYRFDNEFLPCFENGLAGAHVCAGNVHFNERTVDVAAWNANVFANLFDIGSQNIFDETVTIAVNNAWVVKVVGITDEHVKPLLIEFNWCIEE